MKELCCLEKGEFTFACESNRASIYRAFVCWNVYTCRSAALICLRCPAAPKL